MIPLGHANPLGLALAHTGAHRILREPTTLVDGWDLILDYLKIAHNFHFEISLTSTLPLYSGSTS